ncbi:hypothetical protein VST7929_01690 [Vibrio stylophorae]|uniref:Phosphohydrolase n=1 Tax=Vibrio stylophorae TaxID=659351 RepID=A0ABM8ZV17_9VIBR|nr:HD domain-containing phosphohydrolase [Vibrio stylophorae]CAH0533815.1 hypothetical protein VST7929_01690 [Vibrio stylophorae]
MDAGIRTRKFSLRFTVGTLFLITTILTATIAISLQYYFTQQMAQEHVLAKLTRSSRQVSDHIQQIETSASSSAKILRSISVASPEGFSEQHTRDIFIQVLIDNPLFYSLYYGNKNEDFYQIINLDSSPQVRDRIQAHHSDRWVIIDIQGTGEQRQRKTQFLNSNLQLRKETYEPSNFYPTQRPWFHAAPPNDVYKTAPYLFKHLQITGQTYSTRSQRSVIGVDIVLSSISEKLNADYLGFEQTPSVEAFVFSQNGQIIASNQKQTFANKIQARPHLILTDEQKTTIARTPILRLSNQNDWAPYDFSRAGEPQGYAIDRLKMIADITGLEFEFVNGFNPKVLAHQFSQQKIDFLHGITPADANQLLSVELFKSPLAIAQLKPNQNPNDLLQLSDLKNKTIAIVEGRGIAQWIEQTLNHQDMAIQWLKVDNLAQAQINVRQGKADLLIDSQLALMKMPQPPGQAPLLQQPLINLPPMPIYLWLSAQHAALQPIVDAANQAISTEQQQLLSSRWLNQNTARQGQVPYPKLMQIAQDPQQHHQMILSQNGRHFFYISPVSHKEDEFFAVAIPSTMITQLVWQKLYTAIAITLAVMLMLLPLAWAFGAPIVRPISKLRQETDKVKNRQFDQVTLINSRIREVHELSLSMVEMAQKLKLQAQERENFVEAFIKIIAQAIDDKSPYTGGHCRRVPELGMILADIVEQCDEGKFASFHFANEQERREFRIAAWLHDCGKITTPEHIVDKGTKLEVNYNRIHEIRTRFEVLWRDAEIDYLISQLDGSMSQAQAAEKRLKRQNQLQQEFATIARANIGSEYMSADKITQIQTIGQQTWVRHFDNRLGLSPFEEQQHKDASTTFPVVETLLADKPEHIIARTGTSKFDPKFGIKMQVPEHLYNHGELYNLTIQRGTLTAEDRFKINEHMISGIKMLEAMPFPPELARVPRYASTHHETMDGKGYPRQLNQRDLSIAERILMIADIFEALTAADRPYKKAKPYSVAIDIMYQMAKNKKIDESLFLLFLQQGGFEQYARIFLPDEQLDIEHVDIKRYQMPQPAKHPST